MRISNKTILIITFISVVLAGCASYGKLERIDNGFSDVSDYYDSRGIPSYHGQSEDIYFNGRQWRERSLELIEGAEDYILIHSFLTTEYQYTREIFDALKRKMEQGVRVYLIFDSASYYRAYPMSPDKPIRAAIPYVEELGIPYTEYNPIRGRRVPLFLKLFDRDHRKYWIVDGKTVSCGGQNIDYDSLRDPEDAGLIDSMIEIESPGFTDEMLDSFVKSWNRYSIDKINRDAFQNRSGNSDNRILVFNQGVSGGGQITTMFDGFFTYAKESVWMVQCYTFVTPALLDKVRFAVDRGVEVNFIISENQVGTRFDRASHYSIRPLLDAGANVYLFDSPDDSLLHYKLILADGEVASIGSANYNLRSQTTSRELAVVFEDQETVSVVNENLKELLMYSREVSYEEAMTYQGFEYLANYILMQFWG